MSDQVPEDVRAFLSGCVGSLDELGMLFVLMASATRWWTAQAAGVEIGVSGKRAGQILERFASCNLLDIKIANDVSYRFRPGNAELQAGAASLLALYQERPAAILRWAAGLGGGRINDFADAFRLKRS